ncbi:2-succinyl-5-enolpyruvyl-6-hydroxy-3-cyclohexene-1-carboxylic-acid synthase [Blastococcus sp. Marseille-P5729]|uniref:2-succinyl-5-enolpyruvyl-6-hydroxy-3- cyclohexene-1-carboxylic-acid synthase n=1 Tax=Blastococcus sp. Marseille-P5729 TaxID=2086582 RepID=UPI000D100429|nr:2-succinyl-5-enolpyruvyl-6-hydroxy-3-cyclohexene-1-carboxylic-acid synthase [Blastococcus sp. Marseille-P5729]
MSAVGLARATIRTLLLAGVREFVLCPGSRNTPLSLELAEAESRGLLRLHVRIDERTAAFLALGLAKGSGVPAAVVSTSGTAVANFHPAVVEASMSHTPIAVVTANRPLSMLGTGANQTIPQVGIFGDATRATVHVADERPDTWQGALHKAVYAMGGSPVGQGPVQIDLGFSPPLVPTDPDFITPVQRDEPHLGIVAEAPIALVALPPRSLVVVAECAAELAESAVRTAVSAGFPVHIEAGTSLTAANEACLRAGAFLLRSDLIREWRPEHLLVVGRPTLSRPIPALVQSGDLEVTIVSDDPSITNPMQTGLPPARASKVEITGLVDADFARAWERADIAAAEVIDAQTREVFDAGAAVAVVAESRPDVLVVASSNPVRDLDERAVRRSQRVVANRGAAGIDGLVSTAVGVALAVAPARTTALLGDLAFLHDANGLVIGPSEPRPDLTVVVVNNDGGAIFASLEQGAPEYAEHFERVFGTPHGADLEALCAATSTPYQRCGDAGALADALAAAADGIRVIEVPVSREQERERRQDLARRVLAAVETSLATES